ncbi:hypothetical protein GCM10018987_43620 [Streptomyces cremeus]
MTRTPRATSPAVNDLTCALLPALPPPRTWTALNCDCPYGGGGVLLTVVGAPEVGASAGAARVLVLVLPRCFCCAGARAARDAQYGAKDASRPGRWGTAHAPVLSLHARYHPHE